MNKQRNVGKKKNSGKIRHLAKKSLIISAISKFAKKVYSAISKSKFGSFLSSGHKAEEKFERSAIINTVVNGGEKKIALSKKFKNKIAASLEKSFFIKLLLRLKETLFRLSLQSYGIVFLAFGVYVLSSYVLKSAAAVNIASTRYDLAAGIAFLLISIFLLSSKKSLSQAIMTSKIVSYTLFGFFSFRSENMKSISKEEPLTYVGIPFIFGMLLGVISGWLHATTTVIVLLALIIVSAVLSVPETGILMITLVLPFLGTVPLAALTGLTFVSFFIKYLCGRRTISMSIIDIPVILFAAITLSGGIVSKSGDSLLKSLVYTCFILSYIVTEEMFRSRHLIKRALGALSVSAAIVSIIGIFEYFVGSPSAIWQDSSLFSDIKGRVVSTFENPNVLGEYLILTIPISLGLAYYTNNRRKSFAYTVSAILGTGCLVLTWSRGAWLGFILAGTFALLLISRKWFVAGAIAFPVAVTGVLCLDTTVLSRFTSIFNLSDSSTSYRINIWKSTLKMLKDVFAYGIGIGESAFASVFPYYAATGITSAYHSHSLYLQLVTETGIFSLFLFLTIAFITVRKNISFAVNSVSPKNKVLTAGMLCGIIAFLIQGFTDHVFYNYRVCLLFWLILGLSVSFIEFAKNSAEEKGSVIEHY